MKENFTTQWEGVRDASVSQDILANIRFNGVQVCYDRISVVDYTSGLTMATIGFKQGASESLVESFDSPAAGHVVSTQARIFMPVNFSPFVRVTGGSPGDRIALFAYGYVTD